MRSGIIMSSRLRGRQSIHSPAVFRGVVALFWSIPPCVLSGTPAYPDPVHDPTHQLPLTTDILSQIVSNVMPTTSGAFMCVELGLLQLL